MGVRLAASHELAARMPCYPSRHNVRCHPLTINLHLLINHERRGSILTTQSHHRWNKLILADRRHVTACSSRRRKVGRNRLASVAKKAVQSSYRQTNATSGDPNTHSITSSARPISVFGTLRPSVFAVFRLMARLIFVA